MINDQESQKLEILIINLFKKGYNQFQLREVLFEKDKYTLLMTAWKQGTTELLSGLGSSLRECLENASEHTLPQVEKLLSSDSSTWGFWKERCRKLGIKDTLTKEKESSKYQSFGGQGAPSLEDLFK